ncbi:MAG: CinA family protein [Xanthobacteraceae bacterium]|nr:CinA family protein [Xanthobacteraceae bacterium]
MAGAARLSSTDLATLAARVLALAGERRLGIVTAESCTCGLLASALSEAPGAAELLHGGFVTYTKANKTAALGIAPELLDGPRGAVSPEVAAAMAEGALERSPAGVAIAITGVAGPSPDEDGNPVGLVCMAVARKSLPPSVLERNYGDIGRDAVRERAMIDALREVQRLLGDRAVTRA